MLRTFALLFVASTICTGCGARGAQRSDEIQRRRGPHVELTSAGRADTSVEVVGIDANMLAQFDSSLLSGEHPLFEVFVADAADDAPAVLGATTVTEGRLRFVPKYAFQGGLRYRAVLHLALLPGGDPQSGDLVEEFNIPKPPPQPPTAIEHIYPTAGALPENQLKFYLHFTAPMSRGEAYRRVHLVDETGHEVEGAFLELGEELWDPAMRRFTLLCDPGRVKRGLKPREEFGPVLEEGKRYTLVVDRAWPDANGTPLVRGARKPIRTLAPDDKPVDPAAWKIEPPRAASREPLVVRFGEPLDHSLALRLIRVRDSSGEQVVGRAELVDEETVWRFTPARPWRAGDYRLNVDTALEDLAGNAVGRAFDADEINEVQKRIETQTVTVSFEVSTGEH